MEKSRYVYWKDDDMWLGYLEEFPDYLTQGETEAELRENLLDMYKDLTSGAIPHVRRVAELEISSNVEIFEYFVGFVVPLHVVAELEVS